MIPELEENGYLPEGIHECTVDELTNRFGQFQITDRRPTLNDGLIHYIKEVQAAQIGKYLIVNGSFVTSIDKPNDIDVLLVLKEDIDFSGNLPPFKYNAQSRKYINKYFKLDFHCGFEDHDSSIKIIDLFSEVKNQPGIKKGILKIVL